MATELLTAKEAAEVLGLKPKTLARWRWEGKGPIFRKIGRKPLYARNDLEEYIASSARRSTSDPGRRKARGPLRRPLGHAAGQVTPS